MVSVRITNLYTDKVEHFQGEPPAVAHDIAMAHSWLQEYDVRLTDLIDVLQELELNQALIVEVSEEPILKNEGSGGGTAKDQLGYDIHQERMFEAARWLSGLKEPKSDSEIRGLMLEYDGDLETVALLAYGLEDNDQNRAALKAVQEMEKLGKAEEHVVPPHSITPGTETAYSVTQAVKRAFQTHQVKSLRLAGKHSKGSVLVKDQDRSYILKSGLTKDGDKALPIPSPAAGVSQEAASQGRREAAFYAVAKAWGLEAFLPAAEFVVMDGHDWAVLELLPHTYRNLERVRESDPQRVHQAHESYRLRGVLHRWAVIDFVLGNADRHAANEMIEPGGKIRLIDHGSAFAGSDFNPGKDQDSFVPFYLRYLAGDNFYEMDQDQKLDAMPHLPESHNRVLYQWITDLDPYTLQYLLFKFGIDPKASLARLKKVQAVDPHQPIADQINQLWLG